MGAKRMTVRVPGEWLSLLEELAKKEGCASRSEFVRGIIRDYLKKRGVLDEASLLQG